MNIYVHELVTVLSQEIMTPDRYVHLEAVRPHIYKHLGPSGSFKIQVLDADSNLVAESSTLTAADISASNYFHGYVKFPVKCTLSPSSSYFIQLAATGYTFSGSAFIGWCNDFDLRKYDASGDGVYAPLDMEIWEYKTKLRGDY